jgi:hypothetical protein
MTSTDASARRVLVVGDPLVLRPRRLTDRILARVLGASLDRQLAAGVRPEAAPLLAARAQFIVSSRSRQTVASHWDHLLRVAHRDGTARPQAAPLAAAEIRAAEPAVRELIARLTTPLPVTAQGAALARLPLADATGPVYCRHSAVTLAELLRTAVSQLDPALPLCP